MKRRPRFDGTHQKRALRGLLSWSDRALRTRSGKTLKDLASELAISPATLARYLNGSTPLGSEQFEPFARAFETTEATLIAACFPAMMRKSGDAPSWDFRAELERVYPDDPVAVERSLRQFATTTQAEQRIAIEAAEIAQGIVTVEPDESVERPGRRAIAG